MENSEKINSNTKDNKEKKEINDNEEEEVVVVEKKDSNNSSNDNSSDNSSDNSNNSSSSSDIKIKQKKIEELPEEMKSFLTLLAGKEDISNVKWIESSKPPRLSPQDIKPEPNHRDPKIQRAMKFNFVSGKPDLKTMRRRTIYDRAYDYHCIPRGQRYLLLYTYGPGEEYDVQTDKSIGFRFAGVFETKQKLQEHCALIREQNLNPYGIFIQFHALDLLAGNGIVEIPIPNDGSTEYHHLNQEHAAIMQRYLNKVYDEEEYVQWKKDDAIMANRQLQNEVKEFNKTIKEVMKEIVLEDNPQNWINQVLSEFPEYTASENNKSVVTPGNLSFTEELKNVKTVHPRLVKKYLEILKKSFDTQYFPENYNILYVKRLLADKRWCIMRLIERKTINQNSGEEKKERISEEILFIVDYTNTMFKIDKNEEMQIELKSLQDELNNSNIDELTSSSSLPSSSSFSSSLPGTASSVLKSILTASSSDDTDTDTDNSKIISRLNCDLKSPLSTTTTTTTTTTSSSTTNNTSTVTSSSSPVDDNNNSSKRIIKEILPLQPSKKSKTSYSTDNKTDKISKIDDKANNDEINKKEEETTEKNEIKKEKKLAFSDGVYNDGKIYKERLPELASMEAYEEFRKSLQARRKNFKYFIQRPFPVSNSTSTSSSTSTNSTTSTTSTISNTSLPNSSSNTIYSDNDPLVSFISKFQDTTKIKSNINTNIFDSLEETILRIHDRYPWFFSTANKILVQRKTFPL